MELQDLELGNSWEVELLRLGGVVLALQNQTTKEAPISNTHLFAVHSGSCLVPGGPVNLEQKTGNQLY